MNPQKLIQKLDTLQRRHHFTAFSYAVMKRYGEHQAGYQAALLTYYAFLSLFPLLLVLTTFTQIIAGSHPALQAKVVNAVASYFPVIGNQLSAHVHSLHKSGLALVIGSLFLVYGTRGVAAAFRYGVNTIWHVPQSEQPGFPQSALQNLAIVLAGGLGLTAAAIVTGAVAASFSGVGAHLLAGVINVGILFGLFSFILQRSLPRRIPVRDKHTTALTAAIGLVVLQLAGGYILARVFKNLDALYSYFALSLGLLFWVYLQAQVLYYAVEISAVHSQKLWPRSLTGQHLTEADTRLKANALKPTGN